ncbi:hypothetical protein UFOVP610_54 [uncultured Caudovirales phage]|uniref:Uncharacterized protein n=1 Tax=uncultured Caudovirales phage TaxID=2100421 RepID=A0A6J5NCP9_9CAUD|nr:hypothetical protein UFOVP610_54 [uncultured Caudovirales phage]
MAYISSYSTELFLSNSASITPVLPTHATNDLILICITQDVGTTAISTATSGWAMIGTQSVSGGCRQAWAYKVAASSSEPDPTFSGTNDDWITQTHIIKDADTTTPIHGNARANFNAVQTLASPALTTTNDDILLLYSWGSDGTNSMTTSPADLICTTKDIGTGVTSIVGMRNHLTAGASPTVTMQHEVATEGGNGWVIAIENKSGGSMGPDVRTALTPVRYYGIYDQGFTGAPNTVTGLTAINSINMGSTVATVTSNIVTNSLSPWAHLSQLAINDSAATVWGGAFDTFPSSVDVTDKSFYFTFEISTSINTTRYGAQGIICVFVDASDNWVAHQLFTRGALAVSTFSFNIQPGTGSTVYDQSVTPIDLTTVNRFGLFVHRTTATTGGSALLRVKNLMLCGGSVAINGSAASPLTSDILLQAYTNWDVYEAAKQQGLAQFLNKQNLQIGNGSDPTYLNFSATSYELKTADKYFGVPDYTCNLNVLASASDTISFASSIVASSQRNTFSIDPSSSMSATYDFTGCSIVGWDVVWQSGVMANSTNFVGCGEIDGKAASFVGCLFSNGLDTNILTLSSGASLDNCSFIKGTAATYAIEIAAAGSFTFSGNTFSGFTTDINVTAATGTVTITLAVGDYTPTYTTAGATVTIVSPTVDITATVVAGSRVQIYNETTATEIDNAIEATTSYSFTVTSEASDGDIIRIRVTKLGLDAYTGQAVFSSTAGASFFVSQPTDDVYTTNGIDGSTVTEFAEDYPNVQVDIDDPDGTTNLSRLYAWFCYVITTSSGIEDWFGGLVAEDVANFRIVDSILDLKLDNVDTAGVIFTGGQRLYREDGAIPVVATTSGGGSIVLYADKVFIAETGTSGLTAGEAATLSKLDDLTEDVSGTRFTKKALENSLTVPKFIGLK